MEQRNNRNHRLRKNIPIHYHTMTNDEIDRRVNQYLAQERKKRNLLLAYGAAALFIAIVVWFGVYILTGFNVLNQKPW